MPKQKRKLMPEEQRKRFEDAVQEMIDAGDLDPTEAEAAIDRMVRRSKADAE